MSLIDWTELKRLGSSSCSNQWNRNSARATSAIIFQGPTQKEALAIVLMLVFFYQSFNVLIIEKQISQGIQQLWLIKCHILLHSIWEFFSFFNKKKTEIKKIPPEAHANHANDLCNAKQNFRNWDWL